MRGKPDTRCLNVHLPIHEFEDLQKLRGPGRKWREFFRNITGNARKAAEINQELRERVEFLESQLERE